MSAPEQEVAGSTPAEASTVAGDRRPDGERGGCPAVGVQREESPLANETLKERLRACMERVHRKHASLPNSDSAGRLDAALDCHRLRFWIRDIENIEAGLKKLEAKL